MERLALVIARWNENLNWLAAYPGKKFIVQKGVHLPNEGREASSYLWFLATQEIDPKVTYGFMQGDVSDHGVTPNKVHPVHSFTPLGTWRVTDDHEGRPHHPGLPLAEKFTEWFGKEPPRKFTFTAGANFLIPGELLLTYPKDLYADLWPRMGTEWEAPWCIERHWEYIWPGPHKETP